MKKSLLVMLLAILSFFMFVGISQAGQCIYLGSVEDDVYYYDSSDVKYSGDIVSFVNYGNNACEEDGFSVDDEIDCARRMVRDWTDGHWISIEPGSPWDAAWQKLCR